MRYEKEALRDRALEARLSRGHTDEPLWPINIECDGGTLSGSYYPQTAIEALTLRYEEMGLGKSDIENRIAYARQLMSQEIRSALSSALIDFVLESVFIQVHHHFIGKLPDSNYEWIKQRAAEQSLLRAGINPYPFKWDEGTLLAFKSYYDKVYPIWKDAARIVKQNRHLPIKTVLKMVSTVQSGVPQNLISRLAGVEHYESTPSYISLHHAAQLCGLAPDSLTSRQLRKHLAKARKLSSKI